MKDLAPSEKEVLNYLLPFMLDETRNKVKFFMSGIKIKYRDYNWTGITGYPGSCHYDPILATDQIFAEHISSLQTQLNDANKLLESAERTSDLAQISNLKGKAEEISRRIAVVMKSQ